MAGRQQPHPVRSGRRLSCVGELTGTGSVLLLPEVLGKLLRDGSTDEVRLLAGLLARLDLRPADRATAELATSLATRYQLRAADAVHLATAVAIGADRFITNNKRDFPATMPEIAITSQPICLMARADQADYGSS